METLFCPQLNKLKLWNNENSPFFLGIDYICDMLDPEGNVYSQCDFMSSPVVHKEFLLTIKAISNGFIHLMRCHL